VLCPRRSSSHGPFSAKQHRSCYAVPTQRIWVHDDSLTTGGCTQACVGPTTLPRPNRLLESKLRQFDRQQYFLKRFSLNRIRTTPTRCVCGLLFAFIQAIMATAAITIATMTEAQISKPTAHHTRTPLFAQAVIDVDGF
jgi:ABC-type nitrate/sulfonate/bicarbonate transport system permease component